MHGCIVCRFKKALDTAKHTRILEKFHCFGIHNIELELLTECSFHQRQQVKIDGFLPETQSNSYGVPQGSILGPLLFLLLASDLPSAVKSCQILLYPDDAILFLVHETPEVLEQELNVDVNRVANWLVESSLSLNLKLGKIDLIKYRIAPKVKSTSCKIELKDK